MNKKGHPTVVFDCMIYLQGVIKETGPAVECLELFERGLITLLVSSDIISEITDVLTRPKLQARFSLLTQDRADKLIEILIEKADLIDNIPTHFSYPRDPKDEKYVNLAVRVNADFIVSRDKDLCDLMTGHSQEAKDFRQRFRPLRVVSPGDFLAIMRSDQVE